MVNPSKTLRDLAGILIRLAKDFEDQHNAQNNQIGATLGNVEERLETHMEELTARVLVLEQQIAQLIGSSRDGQ